MKRGLIVVTVVIIAMIAMSVSAQRMLVASEPAGIYMGLATDAFNEENFAQAAVYFEQAVQANPDLKSAQHNLGISYHELGDNNAAKKALQAAIDLDENYAQAYYSLGLIQYEQNDLDQSISSLQTVALLQPENVNAHFDLGVMYVDRFRVAEEHGVVTVNDVEDLKHAKSSYQTVIDLDPDFAHAATNLDVVSRVLAEYESQLQD